MTDDEPEQTSDDPKSRVENRRPDHFGFVFRSHGGKKVGRPLRMQKLIGVEWVDMASFPVPDWPGAEIYPARLAAVIGGLVRLRIGEHVVEEWEDGGKLVGQTRCA